VIGRGFPESEIVVVVINAVSPPTPSKIVFGGDEKS